MNKILLVDDERECLSAMRRLFASSGDYTLETAACGAEALAKAPVFMPDVVVLDIMMPGMDGYEVCRRLKTTPECAGSLVLFLSGRGGVDDRMRGYEAQADDYLGKPFAPDELLAKVSILLRLKQAQDELRALNRDLEQLVESRTRALVRKERQALVGQMVQGLVHNMKSPLSAATGFVSLAGDEIRTASAALVAADSNDKTRELLGTLGRYLDLAQQSYRNLKKLIDNLLVKGRLESSTERQPIDLNDLVRRELQFLEADMEIKHKVTKTLRLAPSLPLYHGVYADLSQVCANLIHNAVEAMRHAAQKELTVSSWHEDGTIFLSFSDTGCGIAPENLERIFEPFYTTKTTRGDEEGGTGLGLHISAELIRRHGGTISVSSTPGQGALFVVSLPIGASDKSDTACRPA